MKAKMNRVSSGQKNFIRLGLIVWLLIFLGSIALTFTIDPPAPIRYSESLECGVALDY